jgi:hypothetical protein
MNNHAVFLASNRVPIVIGTTNLRNHKGKAHRERAMSKKIIRKRKIMDFLLI